ncbi:hypothetical protein [Anaeromyxobacter dehalogenans]|uniref:Uncharacterized protein n=1 Tax=Anaeromyxobacter dehalogenans (strain 2CP-C) TaxID=290397 RepID=Q2IGW7_ANADE|nr:hypothetical protein [Anaeromyxobacter dehalogenans]ABC83826.1 hypothetical protein Adeh_4062 [Anaeromyxobacter dehalogenans 2CP-C]
MTDWLWPIIACVALAGTPATRVAEAEKAIRARAPGVQWRTPLVADVTFDGRADHVFLGSSGNTSSVGIVDGARGDRAWVLEFVHDPARASGLCGAPGDATIALEDPGIDLAELGCDDASDDASCETARRTAAYLRRAAERGGKGIVLSAGDCDAVHVHFDGTSFRWWRR